MSGEETLRVIRESFEHERVVASVVSADKPFAGLSHAEVLELRFDGPDELVEDIIEAGVVGAIAGIPETHKSWLAQAAAVRVAGGSGEILGRRVLAGGPIGYFWQDDSRRNEAERVQTFERIHASPSDLRLRWFLNEGLELPRDLRRLRATVEAFKFVLVVLDSFYNVAQVDLRDLEGGELVKRLKAEVADPTGCTVLIVDHMPWATPTQTAAASAPTATSLREPPPASALHRRRARQALDRGARQQRPWLPPYASLLGCRPPRAAAGRGEASGRARPRDRTPQLPRGASRSDDV